MNTIGVHPFLFPDCDKFLAYALKQSRHTGFLLQD